MRTADQLVLFPIRNCSLGTAPWTGTRVTLREWTKTKYGTLRTRVAAGPWEKTDRVGSESETLFRFGSTPSEMVHSKMMLEVQPNNPQSLPGDAVKCLRTREETCQVVLSNKHTVDKVAIKWRGQRSGRNPTPSRDRNSLYAS